MKDNGWKPVRSGTKYCAPLCGRGCTWKEYLDAKKKAAELVKRLGRGWKPHIWENLGWHYSAISSTGAIKVHPSLTGGFNAFLGDPKLPGGRWVSRGCTDPKESVKQVVEEARKEARQLLKWIKAYAED